MSDIRDLWRRIRGKRRVVADEDMPDFGAESIGPGDRGHEFMMSVLRGGVPVTGVRREDGDWEVVDGE